MDGGLQILIEYSEYSFNLEKIQGEKHYKPWYYHKANLAHKDPKVNF